jgi:peptidoglycan hydrolase-like protein with peptidoglycan-binding domain
MTETKPLRALPQDRRGSEPVHAPPRRPRHRAGWVLAAVVVLVAAVLGAWQLVRNSDAGAAPAYLTEEARTADLQDRVEAAATVAFPQDATADLRVPVGGTVTAVGMREGDQPTPLAVLIEVNESPLVALASPLPLYRNLEDGLEGPDVQALEQALLAVGFNPGPDDAVFDAQTVSAVSAWEAAIGLEETGSLPLSRVLWLPPGGQITAVAVRLGDPVSPGTVVANVARPDGLVSYAALDQADVAQVAVGDPVDVELDALDTPLSGTVEAVALTPDDDGTYRATVRLSEPPDVMRAGMEGTARVLVDVREDAVVVPSGAVSGSAGQSTVRVLIDGEPEVREVELGLVTTDGAEILQGVEPGDAVVVGERD